MIKNIIYLSLFISSIHSSYGQVVDKPIRQIQGTIFLDINHDGVLTKGEKGLKGILVSNGVDIVKTDKNGQYKIEVTSGQSIFPILPNDLGLSDPKKSNIFNANFVQVPSLDSLNAIVSVNFGLKKKNVNQVFSFGAIGDVQVDNQVELDYASKSILSELGNRKDLAFNIFLGDLVNDKMSLMKEVRTRLEPISTTSMTLVGNHDRNTKNQEYILDAFHTNFGASNYAFNYGKVHFIILNNVYSTGKNAYEGRIEADQLTFVKNDLSHIGKDTRVVICQHIPLRATKNKNELLELLVGFKDVLVLSGHTHTVSRHFYNNGAVQELVAGATSGTWWRGEKDIVSGIPLSLMQCGTPRGYFTIHFTDDNYYFKYKGVGRDDSHQLHLALDSTALIANIYGASDSTLVEVKVNDSVWLPMKKTRMVDPLITQIIAKNKANIYPTVGNTILPVRARDSNHIWTLDLTKNQINLPSTISIRAKDNYGFHLEQEHYITY